MEHDPAGIDFARLLKLRLVVGRHGEMDKAGWWNTNGLLGGKGQVLMSRGLPKTHRFAQARVVFSVARVRCNQVFEMPDAVTLWNLSAGVEDQFEARWQDWLDDLDEWAPFFHRVQELPSPDLLESLRHFGLVNDVVADEVAKMRRSAEGRAVALADSPELTDELLGLLAAGFSRGEVGKPAIPYVKVGP